MENMNGFLSAPIGIVLLVGAVVALVIWFEKIKSVIQAAKDAVMALLKR